ncbi:MAG: aldehyde-activating protein [Candidatus Sericytochromatia bacterium]
MSVKKFTHYGSCYCKNITFTFATNLEQSEINPRVCDCSFCQKHGAKYISDPLGELVIEAKEQSIHEYQQGSNNASFILCKNCGVFVAVIFKDNSGIYGNINLSCLEQKLNFGDNLNVSPKILSAEEKISRWIKLWIPNVIIKLK